MRPIVLTLLFIFSLSRSFGQTEKAKPDITPLSVGACMLPSNLMNDLIWDNYGLKIKYSIYGFPVATNLFWGRRKGHFETGIGLTYQQRITGVGDSPRILLPQFSTGQKPFTISVKV